MDTTRALATCTLMVAAAARAAVGGAPTAPTLPSAERLLGRDVPILADDARRAAAAGRWDEAAVSWLAVVERRAGDPDALFSLACALSRSGRPRQAATALATAWAAGLRDLGRCRSDPDLEPLRRSREWPSLLEALEADGARRRALEGGEAWVRTPVPLPLRVMPPDPPATGPAPLLVVLHGSGGDGAALVGLFRAAGVSQPFVVAAPRGPYPRLTEGRLGFDWIASEGSDLASAADVVTAALDAVLEGGGIEEERVFVLGFSQGATVALALADRAARLRGVALVGVPVAASDLPVDGWRKLAGDLLVFASPDDLVAPAATGLKLVGRLSDAGARATMVSYDGGHTITPWILDRVSRWIAGSSVDPQQADPDRAAGPVVGSCLRSPDHLPFVPGGAPP